MYFSIEAEALVVVYTNGAIWMMQERGKTTLGRSLDCPVVIAKCSPDGGCLLVITSDGHLFLLETASVFM